jgi:anti-anti-sigma regulatory factor
MASVDLGPDLGIESAAELKDKLKPHVAKAKSVVLAAGDVRRVHTAGLQLLVAFVQARQQAGRDTRIDPCSDTLRDAASLLGLAELFGLPASKS